MYVSIRIKGHLDQNWQEWLEGLRIIHEMGGTSRLCGMLSDQPALYGVLNKIAHLSLTLLSLEVAKQDTVKENTMRKVVVSMSMTLDGVVETPHEWSFQFGSEEQQKYKFDELFASDALLLGRVTYEGFAAAWPHMTAQTGAYGERMNSLPKYIASTTLTETEWNASLIKGNVAEEVAKLKQEEGSDLLIFGSVELVRSLMQQDLIDEYRLMVFPLVVGNGKHLFKEGSEKKALKLVETRIFSSGVVLLTYQK